MKSSVLELTTLTPQSMALVATVLLSQAGFAATASINTNNPTAPTGTNSATVANPSTATGSVTSRTSSTSTSNLPLSITPPARTLPPAIPTYMNPPGTETTDEATRRSQRALQSTEVCQDSDAACLRRREEQMRRNTPFNQQTPPQPGVVPPTGDGTLRQ